MKMRKLKLGLASLAAVAVLAGCSSATASGGGVTIDGSTVTIIRRATGSIEILLGGESAGTVTANQ